MLGNLERFCLWYVLETFDILFKPIPFLDMEHLMEQTAFTGYISLDNQELTDQMNLVQLFELVQFSQ